MQRPKIWAALSTWMLAAWFLAAAAEPSLPMQSPPIDTSYLKDHVQTRGFMLGRPTKARPVPDASAVLFLRATARVPRMSLYEYSLSAGQTRELINPQELLKGAAEHLSPEEKARLERMRISSGGLTEYSVSQDSHLVLVGLSGRLYLKDRLNASVSELATGPGPLIDPQFSPDATKIAYVREHDLYVYSIADKSERRVTTGGSREVSHGLAEFVAQEEMGRFSGFWWSPDSRWLAYEEADGRDVEVWHVADPAKPGDAPLACSYPRPGKSNVRVRLGVIAASGGNTTWISWDDKEFPYLAAVSWEKNGPLCVTVQSRNQRDLLLLGADTSTGKTTQLVKEHDSAWITLFHRRPWFCPDGRFLWSTETDGARLDLRDSDGKVVRSLHTSESRIEIVDLDDQAGVVYFQESPDPTGQTLQAVSLKGGPAHPITPEPGVHTTTFSANHAIFVDNLARSDAMPATRVCRKDGSLVGVLPSVAEDPPFQPREQLVRAGTSPWYQAVVVRPRQFDPNRRYPVIMDVYGGPGHQKVLASMGTRLLDQWLADQGFIVVSADGRGTPGRGHAWERPIWGQFGKVPLDDQVSALQSLGKMFPEMDTTRVGVVGWSFGGYLSALAVLRRPDVFSAAVAGAPVVDWCDYDTHYTERYMGMPDADAAAYRDASLLTYASGLSRPLLLIHGTADDNVFFVHTLKLVDALFREGRTFELLPLAGLTHMVPDPVIVQRMWARICGHFRTHLGEPQPGREPGSKPKSQ